MYLVYLFLAVASILLFLLVFLIFSGLFTSIKISVKPPPIKGGAYLYRFYQQHYRLAGEAYREILKFPTKDKHQCLGIYYDDPKKVGPDNTRYTVGVFISDEKREECKEYIQTLQEGAGFALTDLPEVKNAVFAEFPLRTVFSILVAVWRLYPKLESYIEKNKLDAHPYLEICEKKKLKTFAILDHNESFYVPEFHITPVEGCM